MIVHVRVKKSERKKKERECEEQKGIHTINTTEYTLTLSILFFSRLFPNDTFI